MLWLLAFHIISVVCWFAGIFYLPRLFVYHREAEDKISLERFKTMERRLYYGIMTPSGLAATFFGLWLLALNFQYYMQQGWMHAKLSLVFILWLYHLTCGRFVSQFARGEKPRSSLFFRFYNEFPVLILVAVVILVVVKPF